ncbi:MAG TPA: site-2 protease family protein, partial [Thermoanaerobaculia bacterium]|nr:site-2 protease family protein [Thermoanaerobaculia bacterium]
HVETTFLILMGLFVILDLDQGLPIQRALIWITILLISVLFHEIGHAASIGLFGFGRSTIVLGGFGGVTINERRSVPWKEIVISLAGPGFSLLLAFALTWIFLSFPRLAQDPMLAALIPLMIWANKVWAIFNLVPIYPLDGGQALQNLVRYMTTDRRAVGVSIVSSLIIGALVLATALFTRSFFLAILAAMLLMQNYQRWRLWRGWSA